MTDARPVHRRDAHWIVLADAHDVGGAYEAAHTAQVAWAQALPATRASVLVHCATIIEKRREKIVG